MKRPLELYIHIPFCVRKCAYCDFLSAPADREVQRAYVERLIGEIRMSGALSGEYEVSTVFFGGGTPSILPGEWLAGILEALRRQFAFRADAEITVEANPGTLDKSRLESYLACGVDRLSLGLQSADDEELRLLGRIHTWEQFLDNYELARRMGFSNINVDLMSALPGQSTEDWKRTLAKVLSLTPQPEHISAYSLIVEEGTPFYEKYAAHPELLPDEDAERQMYYDTGEILRKAGYERYEISNYAKPGFACRHNVGYWERTEYKGYGLGAASLIGEVRSTNQSDLKEYLDEHFAGTSERLTEQDIREEYFFLGLRMMRGVRPGKYEEHYRKLLDKLVNERLLERKEDRVCLTDRGIDVSNYVFTQFLDD